MNIQNNMKYTHSRSRIGFTLLEILLVIAAIGILAAIVIVAINPQRQLGQVRDLDRTTDITALNNSLEQYVIDQGMYPSGITDEYQPICKIEAVDTSGCVELPALVPTYLAQLPQDERELNINHTGYQVAIHPINGKISLNNPYAEIDSPIAVNLLPIPELSLYIWGTNTLGQYGHGSGGGSITPIRVGSAVDWEVIESGMFHAHGIKNDGSLYGWGNNSSGSVGDGTVIRRYTLVRIGEDVDWVSVHSSAMASHSLGLKADGSLYGWGSNSNGQVGEGTTVNQLSPVQIGIDTDWVDISVGATHTLALKSDGSLYAWGSNAGGRLGDGTIINKSIPVRIGLDNDWMQIRAGSSHSVAIKSDGSLYVWGQNLNGQLGGAGGSGNQLNPVRLGSANDWAQISTGQSLTLAIRTDGSLYGWGSNSSGQIGDGTTTMRFNPIRIGLENNWASVEASSFGIKMDGSLWAWGGNNSGRLGDGTTVAQTSPIHIGMDNNWASISSGALHTMGLQEEL